MKALVLEDFGRLAVHERPVPRPGAHEVLVQVSATGICGSDIHGYTGENGRRHPGQVMGHESAGRIAELGEGVQGWHAGQPVTFNPLVSCGHCAACLADAPQHCADRWVIGVAPEPAAAFAEYLVVPEASLVALGDRLPLAHGALVEPLAVAVHAVRRARLAPGARVLVTGGGPIGQSLVLACLRAGASTVLVTDPDPARRELCARLGALPLDPTAGAVDEQVRAVLGAPADLAIDAVGVSATIADCLAATRPGAVVCLVGMGAPRLELGAFLVSTEERELIGSFCYGRADFREAADWLSSTPEAARALVSREVGVDDAPEAFAALAAGDGTAGKVLVRFA